MLDERRWLYSSTFFSIYCAQRSSTMGLVGAHRSDCAAPRQVTRHWSATSRFYGEWFNLIRQPDVIMHCGAPHRLWALRHMEDQSNAKCTISKIHTHTHILHMLLVINRSIDHSSSCRCQYHNRFERTRLEVRLVYVYIMMGGFAMLCVYVYVWVCFYVLWWEEEDGVLRRV